MKKINHYYTYDSINDILKLNVDSKDETSIINDSFYKMGRKIKTKYVKSKDSLITSEPFLYHPSGIPILFHNDGYSHQDYVNEALKFQDWYTEETFDFLEISPLEEEDSKNYHTKKK